jgi:hypothetical protein
MHKALREVLGDHVQQKGSLVNAERTRFDFAHNAPVTDAQIREIEAKVNAEILANAAAQARVMDIESAQKTGAMMLFGEKYGETCACSTSAQAASCAVVHTSKPQATLVCSKSSPRAAWPLACVALKLSQAQMHWLICNRSKTRWHKPLAHSKRPPPS